MAGYTRAARLSDVMGRIDYISNEERQERILGFYDTTNLNFWYTLAQENQQRFKENTISNNEKNHCIEAREFVIGIPQRLIGIVSAEQICKWFKRKYGVECCCALHYKAKNNNFHAHIIYSERTLFKEPIIFSEAQTAPRTYYYDKFGKKCKKADAVKITPKGTVIKPESVHFFTNKITKFKQKEFLNEFSEFILHEKFQLEKFDNTKQFKHIKIGRSNPYEKEIRAYNETVNQINYLLKAEKKFIKEKKDRKIHHIKEDHPNLYWEYFSDNFECFENAYDKILKEYEEDFVSIYSTAFITEKTFTEIHVRDKADENVPREIVKQQKNLLDKIRELLEKVKLSQYIWDKIKENIEKYFAKINLKKSFNDVLSNAYDRSIKTENANTNTKNDNEKYLMS